MRRLYPHSATTGISKEKGRDAHRGGLIKSAFVAVRAKSSMKEMPRRRIRAARSRPNMTLLGGSIVEKRTMHVLLRKVLHRGDG